MGFGGGKMLWCGLWVLGGCGAPTVVVLQAPAEPAALDRESENPVSTAGPSEQPLMVAGSEVDLPPATREVDCRVPLPEPRCRRMTLTHVRASSNQAEAQLAVDGSVCTVWDAGRAAPQFLELDLGEPGFVDGFELVPEMITNGAVTHVIEVSLDGKRWEPAHRIEGAMQSGVAFEMLLPKTMRARFLKVSTLASPSSIAWRDIVVLHCSGGP